jgi:hypothetical protein
LPEYYDGWAVREAAHLEERYFRALHQLITHLEAAGDLERALEYVFRAVERDGIHESAVQDLLRLLVATGERERALHLYEAFARRLKEELGAEPEPATRALIDRAPGLTMPAGPLVTALPLVCPGVAAPATLTLLMLATDGSQGQSDDPADRAPLGGPARDSRNAHGGQEIPVGAGCRGFLFGRARDALNAALGLRRKEQEAPGPPLRMALHTGDLEPGPHGHAPIARHAAHLLLAAHPGQTLCSEATAVLLRRARALDARLLDLGFYTLEESAERLFQVEGSDLPPREFPLPRAPRAVGELPLTFQSFVGREEEIECLCGLLGGTGGVPPARLVTLTGPGGIGKTRLACPATDRDRAMRHLVRAVGGADRRAAGFRCDPRGPAASLNRCR